MKLRAVWTAVLFVGAGACNYLDCGPPPPTDSGTEWVHDRGRTHEAACATSDDVEPNQNTSERSEITAAGCGATRTLKGSVWDDVDTFHVRTQRCGGHLHAKLDSGEGVRFCVFASCAHGTSGLVREELDARGETARYGLGGLLGHCRTTPGDVDVWLDCSGDGLVNGTSSDADVFVVVDHLTAAACVPYTVSYSF